MVKTTRCQREQYARLILVGQEARVYGRLSDWRTWWSGDVRELIQLRMLGTTSAWERFRSSIGPKP